MDPEENDLEGENFHSGDYEEDPIAMLDANMSIMDPRGYFLAALEYQTREMTRNWKNVVYTVRGCVQRYVSQCTIITSLKLTG